MAPSGASDGLGELRAKPRPEGLNESFGIAVDRRGAAYIAGSTTSSAFPLRSAVQPRLGGPVNAFVAKLSPAGNQLVYSTYLGGNGIDAAWSIAVDAEGSAIVCGETESRNFPVSNGVQPRYAGAADAFVTKLNTTGTRILTSSYLGGAGRDAATAAAVDSRGTIYLTGSTASSDFPTRDPIQPAYAGGVYYGDAFVAAISASGRSLLCSTYLGGIGGDVGTAIAVSAAGRVAVTGGTSSAGFPVKQQVTGSTPARGNAFVVTVQRETADAVQAGLSRVRWRSAQVRRI